MISVTARCLTILKRRPTNELTRRSMSTLETIVKRKESEEEEVPRMKLNHKKWKKEEEDVIDTKYCETDYYFDGYLRKVYPYYFTYKTFCKRRWIGRKLTDVINDEFRVLKEGQLEQKINIGDIRVNDAVVDVDYVLVDLDRISSRIHRHELPVLSSSIQVVHEDDDFVVINKPPSLPVHPCGRYRFNTTIALLYKEYGYKKLHIIHRLDRLTSGILMFAKTTEAANKVSREICSREVSKEYLCRVEGDFPFTEEVSVNKKLKIICKKIGLSVVTTDHDLLGKESETVFKKLSYNGKSSLVSCKPKTGRTHQIRVHLQYLGFPIINDPLYNSTAFGPKKGKDGDYNGMTTEELILELRRHHDVGDWIERSQEGDIIGIREDYVDPEEDDSTLAYIDACADSLKKEPSFDSSKVTIDPVCPECDTRYMNPKAKHLMLFLHALRYSGKDFDYKTPLPFWAKDDYIAL
jgi:RluA family pseudouridine synthase